MNERRRILGIYSLILTIQWCERPKIGNGEEELETRQEIIKQSLMILPREYEVIKLLIEELHLRLKLQILQ